MKHVRRHAPALHAPHLLDAEVAHVLRRYVLRGELDIEQAGAALDDLANLPITRCPHGPFLGRALELRHNVTVYDALYLALGETLDAPVLTSDAALADVPGCRARVELTTGRVPCVEFDEPRGRV